MVLLNKFFDWLEGVIAKYTRGKPVSREEHQKDVDRYREAAKDKPEGKK